MAKNATEEIKEPEVKEPEVKEAAPELVEIFVPKGAANDDPNLFIGHNGVNYILPKGKTSKVPPAIAAEFKRAIKAQEKMDEHIDEMLKEASK